MTAVAALWAGSHRHDDRVDQLWALVDRQFLVEVGWDPMTQVLAPSLDHPLLSRGQCRVVNCQAHVHSHRLCASCLRLYRQSGMDLESFVLRPRDHKNRRWKKDLCCVPGCQRLCRLTTKGCV